MTIVVTVSRRRPLSLPPGVPSRREVLLSTPPSISRYYGLKVENQLVPPSTGVQSPGTVLVLSVDPGYTALPTLVDSPRPVHDQGRLTPLVVSSVVRQATLASTTLLRVPQLYMSGQEPIA